MCDAFSYEIIKNYFGNKIMSASGRNLADVYYADYSTMKIHLHIIGDAARRELETHDKESDREIEIERESHD